MLAILVFPGSRRGGTGSGSGVRRGGDDVVVDVLAVVLAPQVHALPAGEPLMLLALHGHFHDGCPGACRVRATEEGRVVRGMERVEVVGAAVTCDEHDGSGDLLGVGHEPGGGDLVADAVGAGLASHLVTESGHCRTGALLDHGTQRMGGVAGNVWLDGLGALGLVLIQGVALRPDDLGDEVGGHAHPVIGKGGVSGSLVQRTHLGGAQGDTVVEVPSVSLGHPSVVGGLDHLGRAILHA